jgi:hypothetical protein
MDRGPTAPLELKTAFTEVKNGVPAPSSAGSTRNEIANPAPNVELNVPHALSMITSTRNKPALSFLPLACIALSWAAPTVIEADDTNPGGLGPRPFIDYYLPTPITGSLSKDVWGAAAVGPRDPQNGLEDATMKKWNYWDGKIIKGPDGKYHMFASRWDQGNGHNGWGNSQAVEAVSDTLTGPYVDQGLCWPDNQGGRGHNVSALVMPDSSYAVYCSETRNGDVFTSGSISGPFRQLGSISVQDDPKWHGSNVSITPRPDGGFEIIQRSGQVMISKNILGPYEVKSSNIYQGMAGLPQHSLGTLEDPVIWYGGGWYHIVVNNWADRRAYHLISRDGITKWKYQGVAYDPTKDFVRYTDGTVNHWYKMERPGVYLDDQGHVGAVSLAVIDIPKEQENGNDNHGSKIVVIPFDGAAMDRDLQNVDAASAATP